MASANTRWSAFDDENLRLKLARIKVDDRDAVVGPRDPRTADYINGRFG